MDGNGRTPDAPGPRRRREGSRLLLAAALAGCVAAALGAGWAAGGILDLVGVRAPAVRLAVKTIVLVAAIPASFYAVERFFLARTSRRGDRRAGPKG